jgi:hypothetical protein
MAAPDASPKLPPSTTGNTDGYAPISWTAVAALAVAVFFVILTLGLLVNATLEKQSLIDPRLLIFPAIAVVLAFIARRQIAGSEGTRAGMRYANAGWTIAVVGGLLYATYLFAIEFAVRSDADREFLAFTDGLKDLKPDDPADPNFYSAVYAMIPPGARASVGGKSDAAGIDAGFSDLVAGFRSSDLVRVCSRSPGEVAFKTTGLVDWEQKPRLITCTIKARLTTPEGEFNLVVPMRAVIEDNRQRRWMVVPSNDGYVKARRLTPYGWAVEALEHSGRQFVSAVMQGLSVTGGADFAVAAYVLPGGDPAAAAKLHQAAADTTVGRSAVAGILGLLPAREPGAEAALAALFARPDGRALTESEVRAFRDAWGSPRRFTPAGVTLKSNTDTATELNLRDGKVRLTQSIEVILSQESQPPPTAHAKFVLGLPAATEPEVAAELARLRAAGGPPTAEGPAGVVERMQRVPWRVARVVSDLKPVAVSREGGPGGMGGPPGGMMGH